MISDLPRWKSDTPLTPVDTRRQVSVGVSRQPKIARNTGNIEVVDLISFYEAAAANVRTLESSWAAIVSNGHSSCSR
jgi:hypothetical protein